MRLRAALPPVLARRPAFRAFWLSRMASFLGDGASRVALILLVAADHGPGGVSLLLLAEAVPRFLLGPLAGTLADRVDQRRLMRVCEIGQGVLIGSLALAQPPFAVVLVVVATAGAFATAFGPAGRSAVPALVGPEERLAANALLGLALNVQVAVGPAVGGLLVAATGTRGALAFDAATFLVSALLLTGVPPLPAGSEVEHEPFMQALRTGLRYARETPIVRALVLGLFGFVAITSVDNVALVFFARGHLHLGSTGYGLLVAAFGLGMVAASAMLSLRPSQRDAASLLQASVAASGAGNLLTGLAPAALVAGAGQALGGVGNAVELIALDTLVLERVPAEMRGRVFGLLSTAVNAGVGIALLLATVSLNVFSPQTVFVASGLALLVLLVVLRPALRTS